MSQSTMIPYAALRHHAVIGDRRTAALISADGAIDWLCLPDYSGAVIFGALLDYARGGHWKLGPSARLSGATAYLDRAAVAETTWVMHGAELRLTDLMPWPETKRTPRTERARIILRRLQCVQGEAECRCEIFPRCNFDPLPPVGQAEWTVSSCGGTLRLWSSHQSISNGLLQGSGATSFSLKIGEQVWMVLQFGREPDIQWSVEACEHLLSCTVQDWREWDAKLSYKGPRSAQIRRTAQTIRLLSYAPAGSLVSAPTASMPERIGGDLNFDYRYAWIRDASLSLASLAMIGNSDDATEYMDWLAGLGSSTDSPLQVVYGIRGETMLEQHDLEGVSGFRHSRPIRFGNHAYKQRQLDSLGYLCDCALTYLEHDGRWKPEYWEFIRRSADYTAAHWKLPDNGIWEFSEQQYYVSSRVMSWTALERTVRIAAKLDLEYDTSLWKESMSQIHAEVMERGWSNSLGSFRQIYDKDSLDASALLIPLMGFLPVDHPRVLTTVDRVAERLSIDHFIYRYDPKEMGQANALSMGEHECAFLPCTFWLAAVYAKMGRAEAAERILQAAENVAGAIGLFAEGVDPRTGDFLGNTPLLFSHVEYARAVMEISKAVEMEA